MYQKARDASVPLDTIDRAVKRGTGELEGVNYENVTYEGYAPHGVALYIETLTDNRNRTGSEVRSALSKNGGSLAEPGAVAWQFERKGVIVLPGDIDEDEVMLVALDAGAEDLVDDGDTWRLTCEPTDLNGLRDALVEAGIAFESADLTFLPTQTVPHRRRGRGEAGPEPARRARRARRHRRGLRQPRRPRRHPPGRRRVAAESGFRRHRPGRPRYPDLAVEPLAQTSSATPRRRPRRTERMPRVSAQMAPIQARKPMKTVAPPAPKSDPVDWL